MSEIHTVKQGEYLSGIALDFGFLDWHTIYNDPNNADLWKKRDSHEVLLPGDEVFIPDKQDRQETCGTERRHEFELYQPKNWLNIVLKDAVGNAIANQPYTLTVGEQELKDTTDDTGLVQQEIPIGVTSGCLTLDNLGLSWDLGIGYLDPFREKDTNDPIVSGIQARLNNLGFPCGEVDGIMTTETRRAIRMYQIARMGLDPSKASGEPDEDTRNALFAEHGC
jgi:N-acetylmuramoyl-L-alanine amidase